MAKIASIFLLIFYTASIANGQLPTRNAKKYATDGQFPYVVAFHSEYEIGPNKDIHFHYICSGSIMSEKKVLTAAHCLCGRIGVTKLVATAGTTQKLNNPAQVDCNRQISTVKYAFLHPHYRSPIFQFDIAVVELIQPFTFTEFLKRAYISFTDDKSTKYDVEYVTAGWGCKLTMVSKHRDEIIPSLQYYDLVLRKTETEEFHLIIPHEKIDPNVREGFAIGVPTNVEASGASGNPGAGVVIKGYSGLFYLVGIVAGGRGCNVGSKTFVINVTYFRDWIYGLTYDLHNYDPQLYVRIKGIY